MKIDLSTVLLVIVCVIPGLFAQRSRNSVCPRSFDDQGASSELGELVALGISTHGLAAILASLILMLAGSCLHAEPGRYFHTLDSWQVQQWIASHWTEAVSVGTIYVFVSFVVSHWLGLFYGVWRQQRSPITAAILRKADWLKCRGVTGLLGERPIIYEALNPLTDNDGTPYFVFVEVEMKDGGGFYSGQLSQFAIVKDEEPHKPIFLIKASFKKLAQESYGELTASGLMLDLADIVTLKVQQVAPTQT